MAFTNDVNPTPVDEHTDLGTIQEAMRITSGQILKAETECAVAFEEEKCSMGQEIVEKVREMSFENDIKQKMAGKETEATVNVARAKGSLEGEIYGNIGTAGLQIASIEVLQTGLAMIGDKDIKKTESQMGLDKKSMYNPGFKTPKPQTATATDMGGKAIGKRGIFTEHEFTAADRSMISDKVLNGGVTSGLTTHATTVAKLTQTVTASAQMVSRMEFGNAKQAHDKHLANRQEQIQTHGYAAPGLGLDNVAPKAPNFKSEEETSGSGATTVV